VFCLKGFRSLKHQTVYRVRGVGSPRHQVAQADEFCTVDRDICSIIVAVFPLNTEMCIKKGAESLDI